MRPQLLAIAATQGGVFTRRQALETGHTEREIRTALASAGPWVALRRGAYTERELVESMGGYDDRMRLLDRAAHLVADLEHVMSHDSAARARRIPMLRPEIELSHLTRDGVGGSRTTHGIKHHLTKIELEGVEHLDGMPVTSPARTALDLAREHGLETGVAACDHVLGGGVPRRALSAELGVMWCWPNITRARAALALADSGAESIGESLTRLVLYELGIGVVETQFPVRLGRGVAWVDLRVGRHLIEFDGRLKYRREAEGGLSDRPAEQVVWDERNRERELLGQGLGMSRVVWEELLGRRREQLKARLRHEYAQTESALGTELPQHLAQFAAEMRGRRRRRTA